MGMKFLKCSFMKGAYSLKVFLTWLRISFINYGECFSLKWERLDLTGWVLTSQCYLWICGYIHIFIRIFFTYSNANRVFYHPGSLKTGLISPSTPCPRHRRSKTLFDLISALVWETKGGRERRAGGEGRVPSCLGVELQSQAVLDFCHLSLPDVCNHGDVVSLCQPQLLSVKQGWW